MLFSRINVNKVEWLNLIFENRNQNYGAYVLRRESGNYLFKALLISGFLFSSLILFSLFKYNTEVVDVSKPILDENENIVTIIPVELVERKTEEANESDLGEVPSGKVAEKIESVKFNGIIKPIHDESLANEIPTIDKIENSVIGNTETEGLKGLDNAPVGSKDKGSGTGSSDGIGVSGGAGDVFRSVEVMPTFPGGMDAWAKFLNKSLRYPATAVENNVNGRVVVSFIVEKTGEITNVKVVQGIGSGCDEEAMRVIKKSPFWKPGIQNGNPVRVAYMIPIVFRVQ